MRWTKLFLWADTLLSGSFKLQFIALLVFTLIIVILGGLFAATLWEFGFFEALWWAFLRVTDLGNLSTDQASVTRTIGFFVAVIGWIVFGLLVSIISTSIQYKLNELQKGRTKVYYKGHTVILGWNTTIFSALNEFASVKKVNDPPIVVMANRTAEQMYNEVSSFCKPETLKKVTFRMGNPESVSDQKRVKTAFAKEIIVLSGNIDDSPFKSDASALKSLLAYGKLLKETNKSSAGNIVLEVTRPISLSLIEGILPSIKYNGQLTSNFFPILSSDLIARIITQCALQPGLSNVYRELFSYFQADDQTDSSEIYVTPLKRFKIDTDRTFNELFFSFPSSILIGYIKEGELPVINPKNEEGNILLDVDRDQLVFITDGEDSIIYREDYRFKTSSESRLKQELRIFYNVLVLGKGYKASVIIKELSNYLNSGSSITCSKHFEEKVASSKISYSFWDMVDFEQLLNQLSCSKLNDYDIIIFAEDIDNLENYDARMLMLLAGINSACSKIGKMPRVVMELLDSNNVELAQTAQADDVIIGSEMISNYMVQISKLPERHYVYSELFKADGSEIYFRPIELYRTNEALISFNKIAYISRQHGEIAIGYAWRNGKVLHNIINPKIDERNDKVPNIDYVIVIGRGLE